MFHNKKTLDILFITLMFITPAFHPPWVLNPPSQEGDIKSRYRTYRRCSRTSIDLMVSLNLQGNERPSDLSNCRGHDHHNHHQHQVPQASNEIYRPHQTQLSRMRLYADPRGGPSGRATYLPTLLWVTNSGEGEPARRVVSPGLGEMPEDRQKDGYIHSFIFPLEDRE